MIRSNCRTIAVFTAALFIPTVSEVSAQMTLGYETQSVWVSNGKQAELLQISATGVAVRDSISFPPAGDDDARDLYALPGGSGLAVFQGTFSPVMALYNSDLRSWRYDRLPGWSTINRTVYGGVVRHGNWIYATDQKTGRDTDGERGLVRFALDGSRAERVIGSRDYGDVTAGMDYSDRSGVPHEKLFALDGDAVSGQVDIIDPETKRIEAVRLGQFGELRDLIGIGIDNATGDIYVSNFDGNVFRCARDGSVLAALNIAQRLRRPFIPLGDLDVRGNYLVVADAYQRSLFVVSLNFNQLREVNLPQSKYGYGYSRLFLAFEKAEIDRLDLRVQATPVRTVAQSRKTRRQKRR